MSEPFNPSEAVTFDLQYGHIHLDGAPTRVMVPAEALVALAQAAGEDDISALGHAMGEAIGRRIGVRLAGGSENRHEAVRAALFDEVVHQLSGELALLGLGSLGAERWGRALVFVVDQSPLGETGDALLAEILQASIHALIDKQARVIKVAREGVRVRFLAVSGAAVQGVRARLSRGDSWGSVLAALHASSSVKGGEA